MLVFAVVLFATACAGMISPSTYRVSSVGQINKTMRGVIIAARPVEVLGSRDDVEVGTLTGAVLGGLAGSQIGGDSTSNAAGAVGGAIVGGVVGERLERAFTSQRAIEYVIRTDKGGLINVAQGADVVLNIGQEVFVLLGEPVRVVPVGQSPKPIYNIPPAVRAPMIHSQSQFQRQPEAYNGAANQGYYVSPPSNVMPPAQGGGVAAPQASPQGGYFSYAPQTPARVPVAPQSIMP